MNRSQKGFSLVELIIAVTVLTVIVGTTMGLMHRMSASSADQRRRQAQHTVEEQARLALLNIVRDARLSHNAEIIGDDLVLTAFHATRGNITITYSLDTTDDTRDLIRNDYTHSEAGVLTRTMVFVANGNPVIPGEGADEWRNPFVPVVLQAFEPDVIANRIDIVLRLNLPLFGGEVIADADIIADDGQFAVFDFREWTVSSAVSFRRIPD